MRYVSIDIETLGLDPDYCDTIEFGAVFDDLVSPIEKLPHFHCYITRPQNKYRGEAYAMAMHSKILFRIANRDHGFSYTPYDLLDEVFASWLKDQGFGEDEKIIVAGKNFASFDLNFLKKIGFGNKVNYSHRFLDPGSMFVTSYDNAPPSLKDCLMRAGINKEIDHTALADAVDVIKCIRYKLCN